MRRLQMSVLTILGFALTACGGSGSGVTGHYELDKTAQKKLMEDATREQMEKAQPGAPEEQLAKMMEAALGMVTKAVETMEISLDVKDGGAFTMRMKMEMMGQQIDESKDGTWEEKEGKLLLSAKDDDGKDKTLQCTIEDDGSVVFSDPDSPEMRFVMKKTG